MPGLEGKRGICMSDLEGIMLSEYFLSQCIRRGGVADVYRARQNGEDSTETPQQPSTVTNGGSENAGNRQKDVLGENSDRKSTRLNSSHSQISYAVFCLKK